jgi:hypothetical protein
MNSFLKRYKPYYEKTVSDRGGKHGCCGGKKGSRLYKNNKIVAEGERVS